MVGEKCDDSSGGEHLDADRDQQQKYGDDGPVDKEQYQEDDRGTCQGHLQHGMVTGGLHIGEERRWTGDIGLEAGGRRCARDDVSDRSNGVLAQGRTLVPGQVQLGVDGLAVRALRARRGESIAPQILHMLDVLRVARAIHASTGRSTRGHRRRAAAETPARAWRNCPSRILGSSCRSASWLAPRAHLAGPAIPNALGRPSPAKERRK